MKKIVIMPGGFHPFHAGHMALYLAAQEAFPSADVFVAATDDTSGRPFPFKTKKFLAQQAGVPGNRFIRVKSPFRAEEITQMYDPDDTQLIFVRSEKDAASQPQPGGVKKNGTPAYLQPYRRNGAQPFSKHGYMVYLPTVQFGPGMTSATEIRAKWPDMEPQQKISLVKNLYPGTEHNDAAADKIVAIFDEVMGQPVAEGGTGAQTSLLNAPVGSGAGGLNPSRVSMPNGPDRKIKGMRMGVEFDENELVNRDITSLTTTTDTTTTTGGGVTTRVAEPPAVVLPDPRMQQLEREKEEITRRLKSSGYSGGSLLAHPDFRAINRKIRGIEEATMKNDADAGPIIYPDGGMGGYSPETLQSAVARHMTDAIGYLRAGEFDKVEYMLYQWRVLENKVRALKQYYDFMKKQGRRVIAKNREIDLDQKELDEDYIDEKWSQKYKRSIDCSHPKGFSQRAHCAGRKK